MAVFAVLVLHLVLVLDLVLDEECISDRHEIE